MKEFTRSMNNAHDFTTTLNTLKAAGYEIHGGWENGVIVVRATQDDLTIALNYKE